MYYRFRFSSCFIKKKDSLKNYFENHKGKGTLTLENYNSKKRNYFISDIDIPNPLFKKNDVARYFFFHAVKDGGTLPHNHMDAFNILQSGKKQWVFYDAAESFAPKGFAEMKETFKTYPVGTTAKDWFKQELKSLPNKVEKVYECTQEAGDIVYIPVGFCHAVLNHSEVMGVSCRNAQKIKINVL